MKSEKEAAEYVFQFVRTVVCALLEDPDAATVQYAVTEGSRPEILVTLHASRQECGRVIGRNGDIIRAIQSVCYAVGRKYNMYVTINVRNTDGVSNEAHA